MDAEERGRRHVLLSRGVGGIAERRPRATGTRRLRGRISAPGVETRRPVPSDSHPAYRLNLADNPVPGYNLFGVVETHVHGQ